MSDEFAPRRHSQAGARDVLSPWFRVCGTRSASRPHPNRAGNAEATGAEGVRLDATGLKRPVLVGSSYGGRVMAGYLTTHGTAKLAGIVDEKGVSARAAGGG